MSDEKPQAAAATPAAKPAATATMAPPEFDLTPPDPVPAVAPEKAAGLVPVSEEVKSKLESKVDGFVDDLIAQDANSPEFGKKVDQLTNMGRKEIMAAAGMSNRFLDRPVRAMDKDEGVGANLAELRRVVEDLDPGKRGKLSGTRKILGIIPFGNKLTNYFRSYQSAQTHIQSILSNLASGKDELIMDNAAIDVERQKLWEAMGNLEQMIHISNTLDAKLEEKAAELDATDPAKAKAVRETALFYVRQRTQDLLTQMAVSVQGYLALDLVKKNNVELVKGVDRASTTTVGALRTAVTVAEAMTNQRLVLGQITALNDTTAGIIDSTSTMLRDQTGKIHEQAAASTIPLETLQRAFQNIYDTMDEVDEFKLRALDSMKQTVTLLGEEVEKSKGYIARAEGQAQAQKQMATSDLLSIEG
ncbi:toxic anion resistance protein [Qipengyuania intermedia]|uniref:toxic anion resistance protein n=1 Tax=Qipengyuania intermedia TaxID=2867244 RepID=UPI003CD0D8D2